MRAIVSLEGAYESGHCGYCRHRIAVDANQETRVITNDASKRVEKDDEDQDDHESSRRRNFGRAGAT